MGRLTGVAATVVAFLVTFAAAGVIGTWGYGRHGYTYWTVGSQAHFCYIQYFSCVQKRYPWVEQTVRGNGWNSWTHG